MSNTILIKRSGTANAVPASGNLSLGELAINYQDGNLFYKDSGGTVQTIASKQFVSVSGNITGANVNTGQLSLSGNVISAINTTSNITTTGNIAGNYFLGNGSLLTGIDATSIQNGTSNVRVVSSGGNVAIGIGGTSNVAVFATTGAYITGLISANGNITGGNLNAAGLSLSGNVFSVMNSTSNITTTANAAIGNLLTDGLYHANGVAWDFQQPAGSNTQIQYNDGSGGFGASANFTFNDSTQLLSVGGAQSVTGNITGGNLNAAGLSLSSNVVSALNSTSNITTTANIAGNFFIGNGSQLTGVTASSVDANNLTGNTLNSGVIFSSLTTVGTLTSLSVSGNVTGGNVLTGGLISSTGNITGGNISTSGSGGNISGANVISGTTLSATANVIGGNITTAGLISSAGTITGTTITGSTLSSTGNVNTVGIVGTGNISTTGNISGGNILTGGLSLSANVISAINTTSNITTTANISGGNLLTARVSASGNVDGANINVGTAVYTSNIIGKTNALTLESISNGNINLYPNGTGNIVLADTFINSVASPVQASDAATKQYVDDAVSAGLTIHTPVYVESPINLVATYADGGTTQTVTTISGNKTLTFGSSPALLVNDVIVFSSTTNGITAGTAYFVYSTNGSNQITLSLSYDGTEITTLTNGTGLTIGSRANSGVGATLTNAAANAAIQIDGVTLTSSQRVLVYQQTNAFENGVYTVTTVGNATARWELTRSTDTNTYGPKSTSQLDIGDYFYVQAGDTGAGESYVVTAPVGTIIFGTTNITFTQFSASQVYTANTSAGLSLVGTVFNAKVDNTTTAFDGGGNIVVKASAQLTTPNIGAATGDSLSVTGLITGGNITAGSGYVSTTGNVIGGNITTGGLITATGNIASSANVSGGNILTGGLISATATITGGNLATGGTASATGNITGGNVLTGGLISATATITGGNLATGGTASAGGNITGANLITGGLVTAVGNVIGGNLISGALTQTVNFSISGNVIGNLLPSANATFNLGGPGQLWKDLYLSGTTLYLGDQTFTANATAIATANDFAANNLTAVNSVNAGTTVSAVGNVIGGNINTAGLASVTGNVIAGNVNTAGLASVTGNVIAGNLLTGGLISATGNITSVANIAGGNILGGSGIITTSGNITGGNILFGAGIVSGTGNITGGNIFQGVNQVLDTASTVDGGLY